MAKLPNCGFLRIVRLLIWLTRDLLFLSTQDGTAPGPPYEPFDRRETPRPEHERRRKGLFAPSDRRPGRSPLVQRRSTRPLARVDAQRVRRTRQRFQGAQLATEQGSRSLRKSLFIYTMSPLDPVSASIYLQQPLIQFCRNQALTSSRGTRRRRTTGHWRNTA